MAPLLQEFAFRGPRSDTNDTSVFYQTIAHAQNYITSHHWTYAVIAVLAVIVLASSITFTVCCVLCIRRCIKMRKGYSKPKFIKSNSFQMSDMEKGKGTKRQGHVKETKFGKGADDFEELENEDDSTRGVRYFLKKNPDYSCHKPLQAMELGSRMQKHWFKVESNKGDEKEAMLTIAPVSQNCPLDLDKYQKWMNKLLEAVKVHPYLHKIEVVDYLVDHELLVMVQPLMNAGSLKDMIYKSSPLNNWSEKYAHRSKPLHADKIARYGRHILEAMKFLYSKGFPTLGHIQSGNIFVVNDVCHLGGYENTLLGYKTRLFRLCKDHLQHFDVILFGHVVFEMAAGYELTHLRPGQAEYKTVDKSVRPILEYIFEEGFPHDVDAIAAQDFFAASLSELTDFHPEKVQINDNMRKVLDKVRKGKPRFQKAPRSSFSQFISGMLPSKSRTSSQSSTKSSTKTKEKESLLQGMLPSKVKTSKTKEEEKPLLHAQQPGEVTETKEGMELKSIRVKQ